MTSTTMGFDEGFEDGYHAAIKGFACEFRIRDGEPYTTRGVRVVCDREFALGHVAGWTRAIEDTPG